MDKKLKQQKTAIIATTMIMTAMLMLMMKTEMHDLSENKAVKVSLRTQEEEGIKQNKTKYE